MSERKNAGYTITDSIHIGKAEFVIGEHPKAPSRYVTWECSGGTNYFWGHYFPDRRSAEKNLLERAQSELTFVMDQEAKKEEAHVNPGDKYNAMDIEYESFSIFDQESLFTDKRINKHTVPKGLYAYEIRFDDNGNPSSLEKSVVDHFYGTVILNRPVSLGRYRCKSIHNDDYCFEMGKRIDLSDYMDMHPTKPKEAVR